MTGFFLLNEHISSDQGSLLAMISGHKDPSASSGSSTTSGLGSSTGGISSAASDTTSSVMNGAVFKAAANKIVYGRLRRVPKLPVKPTLQSSESSTASDDLSGSEESSSGSALEGDGAVRGDGDPSGAAGEGAHIFFIRPDKGA